MKKIALKGKYGIGKFALVDDDDYEKLICHSWSLGVAKNRRPDYPVARIKNKIIRMHRFVFPPSDTKTCTDHINGNKLDNRKENLRFVTVRQNMINKNKKSGNYTSKHVGVKLYRYSGKNKEYKYWLAIISIHGKQKAFYCKSEKDAIAKRKELVEKYYGEYAYKNI